jgi:hypothetical protein
LSLDNQILASYASPHPPISACQSRNTTCLHDIPRTSATFRASSTDEATPWRGTLIPNFFKMFWLWNS